MSARLESSGSGGIERGAGCSALLPKPEKSGALWVHARDGGHGPADPVGGGVDCGYSALISNFR
jgi:hypothetical protein